MWKVFIFNQEENSWVSPYTYQEVSTCYWDGKVFVTSARRPTKVLNAFSGDVLFGVPEIAEEDSQVKATHLVESCGEILRVSRYLDFSVTKRIEDSKFHIYKLISEGGGQHGWKKVSDVGDQIVFLDVMNGFSMRAPAGFKGNCIYFLSKDGSTPCRCNVSSGTIERVPCPFNYCTWFIPEC
jgi:Protein of unknown function (DUF295)